MFKLSNDKTVVKVKGFYEGKQIMEIEFDTVEQAELLISRMKTQKWTSIHNEVSGEFGRYFITQMDLEICPQDNELRYFLKLNKYNA